MGKKKKKVRSPTSEQGGERKELPPHMKKKRESKNIDPTLVWFEEKKPSSCKGRKGARRSDPTLGKKKIEWVHREGEFSEHQGLLVEGRGPKSRCCLSGEKKSAGKPHPPLNKGGKKEKTFGPTVLPN